MDNNGQAYHTKLDQDYFKKKVSRPTTVAVDFYKLAGQKDTTNYFHEFSLRFPRFIDCLKSKYPEINAADLKVCTLLKLDFSTKEIAVVTNSTVRAIQSRKFRIRKRLEIDSQTDINIYMLMLG